MWSKTAVQIKPFFQDDRYLINLNQLHIKIAFGILYQCCTFPLKQNTFFLNSNVVSCVTAHVFSFDGSCRVFYMNTCKS